MICSGTTWAVLSTKSPIFPGKEGTGLCAGTAPVSAPRLSKESEQGGERKLLPESETLWGGPQALRAHHNLGITADFIHGHLGGIHTLSRSRCAGTPQGGGGGIDRSKPLKLTNHRSIRHHHRLSLSPLLSLCQLSVSSLSLSASHQAPLCLRQGALRAKRPPEPLVWSERSHDQQASTRSRTDWLTPQAQPRQKDPEGVNSTISELFHMTQQSGWQIKG